ncbi:DSC4 family protein [Aspergillus tanneri]|uniref:DUF1746 domain-containing protein n=1 Tax=Aspergillus tanneri TaxID=1220188 RepID=A0A5M9MG47_9EURO|nr:uncharacterized protein ATNIH1004_007356 [Aspergillus tanneri]KAA8645935.1 hypothetical protein ATNIH1004_007356 [Aspergillus tanneri]
MTTPDVFRDAEYIADVSGISYDSVADVSGRQSSDSGNPDGRIKKVQSAAKVALIDRLLRDFDVLIYCQLSALYYMDCSIVLFATRAIVQLIFFTPKAPPFDPTRNQPFVGAIFASNLICMTFHYFFVHPEAGESTRGYLHGGLLIDFIGQKAPVPMTRLLSMDLLVMILDIVMLGLIVERVKTTEATASVSSAPSAPSAPTTAPTRRDHDHDSEERGIPRYDTTSGEDGIELDTLGSRESDSPASPSEQLERTQLLADPAEGGLVSGIKNTHALDSFSSGEAVIMNRSLLDIIREQWRYSQTVARRTPAYVPSDQTAAFLRERFGLQVRPDGRVERIGPGS